MVMFQRLFGPDDPQRGGLTVLNGNAKVIEIVPVLNETFRHTLCHVETLQTYSNSKQEEGAPALPIDMFNMLTQNLTVFLSKVYTEVEEARKWNTTRGNRLSASVLVNVNTHFLRLDASIQSTCGYSLGFHKITHDDQFEQWTNDDVQAAIDFSYTNLDILDAYLSALVSRYRKPRKIAQHWMYYTLGAIGISIFSVWLLRRSGLSHSTDGSVLEAIGCLFRAPVEQHIKAKRKELCKPSIARGDEPVELNEATESLHSMLVRYIGNKSSENLSDKEMIDIVESKLKNHIKHPILNILKVEKIIQGILIQVERLHVEYEKIKYEVNQLFVAHEGKIAIFGHIPTIFFSAGVVGLIAITIVYLKMVSSAKRKEKAKKRVLLSEVESRINEFVTCSETAEELRDKSCEYLHGLVLCTLNRYYKKIEKYAEATGEWDSLKRDLIELGKSSHDPAVELNRKRIIGRLYNFYKCANKMPDQ